MHCLICFIRTLQRLHHIRALLQIKLAIVWPPAKQFKHNICVPSIPLHIYVAFKHFHFLLQKYATIQIVIKLRRLQRHQNTYTDAQLFTLNSKITHKPPSLVLWRIYICVSVYYVCVFVFGAFRIPFKLKCISIRPAIHTIADQHIWEKCVFFCVDLCLRSLKYIYIWECMHANSTR